MWPRWIFLRALGLVFLSAFYSLAYQIHGLIGPTGILPADTYLSRLADAVPGVARFWYAPTFLWLGAGHGALTALVVVGTGRVDVARPRRLATRVDRRRGNMAFLPFIAAPRRTYASTSPTGCSSRRGSSRSSGQPPGFFPRLGRDHPPSHAATFLLQWEWFRIYFESGWSKLASGDPSWRDMTAMDHYYENGPLPTLDRLVRAATGGTASTRPPRR